MIFFGANRPDYDVTWENACTVKSKSWPLSVTLKCFIHNMGGISDRQ